MQLSRGLGKYCMDWADRETLLLRPGNGKEQQHMQYFISLLEVACTQLGQMKGANTGCILAGYFSFTTEVQSVPGQEPV